MPRVSCKTSRKAAEGGQAAESARRPVRQAACLPPPATFPASAASSRDSLSSVLRGEVQPIGLLDAARHSAGDGPPGPPPPLLVPGLGRQATQKNRRAT